ncbi:MAG: ATP-binding protein [Actinomycetes bacterium]
MHALGVDTSSPHQLADAYLAALLKGERRRAMELVDAAVEGGLDVEALYLDVFQPALREVGRLWACGQASVAQEHVVTSATQVAMARMYPRIVATPRNGARVVVAAIGGERHEIGARMVADLFELHGWEAQFLGANTPTGSVVEAVLAHEADLLALSATRTEAVSDVREVIAVVRDAGDVPVLVGGRPFAMYPDLWRSVGADATAPDARSAIAIGARLAGLAGAPSLEDALLLAHVAETPEEQLATRAADALDATGRRESLEHAVADLSETAGELAGLHRLLTKQAAELDRANARKDALLGMAAHDLRSPLTAMTGFTWALRRVLGPDLDPQAAMLLERIESSTTRMLGLVEDLLETAVLADGTVDLVRGPVDVAALVREVVATHQQGALSKGITLAAATPATLVADVDAARLTQVLDNLVANAVKFTPPDVGAGVEVTVLQDAGEVLVRVRDEGVGVSDEFLPLLFEPFAHEHGTGTAGEPCTGLGLSITRSLVEAHGGRIEVVSAVGEGTTFVVQLPLTEPAG